MSGQKWGESFLKSGLPLEHLTVIALKSIGWTCELHFEYRRVNREGEPKWFEHDVIAYSPESERGDLQLLMECKYHDESRFWFFLPCETEDHLAQYGALSAGENLYVDSAVLHSAPYELLAKPGAETLLPLAPKSVWGVTVSQGGTRQPNAVEEATKQLGFGFVPFCLENFYGFHRSRAVSVLPVIATSARLFRLRPEINTFDRVRGARAPNEVADEVAWLWYYHAANGELLDHNMAEIDAYKKGNRYAERKIVAKQLLALWSSPHWIAVINIEALAVAVDAIYRQFSSLPKDFSGDQLIAKIWKERRRRRTSGRGVR
jgi:hypothetical protein